LATLSGPTLFWLDGHDPGEGPGKGNTPILAELKMIAGHKLKDRHAILIDDARTFVGSNGRPTIPELMNHIANLKFRQNISIENDIIKLTPLKADDAI
jgi:hypothetical protein